MARQKLIAPMELQQLILRRLEEAAAKETRALRDFLNGLDAQVSELRSRARIANAQVTAVRAKRVLRWVPSGTPAYGNLLKKPGVFLVVHKGTDRAEAVIGHWRGYANHPGWTYPDNGQYQNITEVCLLIAN